MAVYPDGVLAAHVYGPTRRAAISVLIDRPGEWLELKRAGWRIVRVRLLPLRR